MRYDFDLVASVMGKCCIIRCEYHVESGLFQYVAKSPCFRALTRGEAVPTYVWHTGPEPDSLVAVETGDPYIINKFMDIEDGIRREGENESEGKKEEVEAGAG